MRFQLSGSVADGTSIPFVLTMTDDSGSRPLNLEFVVSAPKLAYFAHRLDDTAGNYNAVIDPGETVGLEVVLANSGGQSAANVQATLTSGSGHAVVVSGQAGCLLVPAGGQGTLNPEFQVAISSGAPAGEVLTLNLALTAGAGYQAASSFKIKVGTNYYYEAEADGPWSLAASDDNAATGRWVRVDPIGTTYNGQPCQPEDDHTADPGTQCFVTGQGVSGGAAGDNDVDGGKTTLTTPLFDITHISAPRLTYWRWYTNNLGNNPNADIWLVQVSSDAGTSWIDLEHTTSSGNSWQEQSFLLASYIAPTSQVVARFVASDDANNSLIEAAVDDIEISGLSAPVSVQDGLAPLALRLAPVRPSPSRGGAVFSFVLPAATPVSLKLYDVCGRLVRGLVDAREAAGMHEVRWDGTDAAGAPAAAGVYFCRLQAGARTLSQRLVIVP